MIRQEGEFNSIVDQICNTTLSLDEGVDLFSDKLYEIASQAYGRYTNKNYTKKYNKRKFRKKWFNNEREYARRGFPATCREYRNDRSYVKLQSMKTKRRDYKKVIRKAKGNFDLKQREELHRLAKSSPQRFWDEIKKIKNKRNNDVRISSEEFFCHFKELFSNDNMFKNDDIEEELENYDTYKYVENLDMDIEVNEVQSAILAMKRGKSA